MTADMSPGLLAAIDGVRAILKNADRLNAHERSIFYSALQQDLASRCSGALDIGPPTEVSRDPRGAA